MGCLFPPPPLWGACPRWDCILRAWFRAETIAVSRTNDLLCSFRYGRIRSSVDQYWVLPLSAVRGCNGRVDSCWSSLLRHALSRVGRNEASLKTSVGRGRSEPRQRREVGCSQSNGDEDNPTTFGLTMLITIFGLAALGVYTSVGGLSRQGIFQILSAHTGTGFTTVPSSELALWGGAAFGGMAIAMALGGMASSTAGGVKALRVGLVLKAVRNDIKVDLLPEGAIVDDSYEQFGRQRLTNDVARSAMVVSLLFVALFLVGAGVGVAYGVPLQAALFESVSAGANVGLSVGVTRPAMPVLLKLTYILQMLLGRLEFIAVFVLVGFVVSWVRGR